MRGKFTSHFFLLPQNVPLVISCSMSGWSAAAAHPGGCWAAYRSRARIIAELPTVHPRASEASWLSCWRRRSASWLSVKVWGESGCFLGVDFARATSEIISHQGMQCYEENNL
jgi:hypothetical protein